MVLDNLGSSIRDSFKKLMKSGHINEALISEVLRDIQRALLLADVDVSLVADITTKIRQRIDKKKKKFSKKELIINSVYDELVSTLGTGSSVDMRVKPMKILLVGLFGSGKTTTSAKLAKFFKKRGRKPSLVGLDTFRPAAMKQIQQLGAKINVDTFIDEKEKKPEKILKKYKKDLEKFDVIIADSAGRDALDKNLIKEIKKIDKELKPDYTFLVLPADIGQNARPQTEAFQKALKIDGVIITRMDGTGKAGGALTACAVTGTNVQFIGVGENVDDLEEFQPKRFVSVLLGMGDLDTLLEKAEEIMDVERAEETAERMMEGKFDLLDLYSQMEAVGKMGSLQKIVGMVPGLSMANLPKGAMGMQEDKMKSFRYLMDSMTLDELKNPKTIKANRIERIAAGAGKSESEVRELIKQYSQMKNMMKKMSSMKDLKGGNIKNLMKQFKGMKGLQ